MNPDLVFFFDGKPEALRIYEALEARILAGIPDVRIRVSKSQVSFYNRHMFACVSLRPVRKKAEMPAHFIVVSFGLGYRSASARVALATEPYPNRWTHHVVLASKEEIDGELMALLTEAAEFSAGK